MTSGGGGPDAIAVRVYYEDTDFSGSVYHAAFLKFMERGRTEFLRARDIHHAALAADGVAFAVTRMEIAFRAAGRIDDQLTVATEVERNTGARLVLWQRVSRANDILVEARVEVAAIKLKGGPARLPAALVARLGA